MCCPLPLIIYCSSKCVCLCTGKCHLSFTTKDSSNFLARFLTCIPESYNLFLFFYKDALSHRFYLCLIIHKNSTMQLQNKTVLVTGGATGIGYGLAQNLAALGNQVIITGRRIDKLQAAQQAIPGLLYFACDVSDPAAIDDLFRHLDQQGIVLDVIFNNAGVLELWDIPGQSIASTDIFTKINTNLSGPIAITQHFIRQADPQKDNYIV